MKIKLFKEYRGLRKELYILFLGRMMTNMGSFIQPVLTLILNQKLGMDATQTALFILIFSIISLPAIFIGGKLADKFNKKLIIVILDIISVIGYIVCFFLPITIWSVIIVLVSSLFQSMEGPSYEALVADFTTSKDRERAYSLSYLGSNLGLVLSPTIAGLLFEKYLNVSFLITGCSILISTLFIFFFIKNVSVEKDDSLESESQVALNHNANTFKYLFKNKTILTYLIVAAIGGGVYSMFGYLMPLDLTAIYGSSQGPIIYGTMNSLNCVIVVVCTSIITRLFKRIVEVKKMIIAELLMLSGFLIFFFIAHVPPFVYIGITIFTFGEIFNTLASSPFISKRIPSSHRGRIISIYYVFSTLVTSLVQIGAGSFYDNVGRNGAWIFVISLTVLTIGGFFIVRKLDLKYYRNLHYGVTLPDGHVLSIKSMIEPLLEIYFKDFVSDPIICADEKDYVEFKYSDEWFKSYYKKITEKNNRRNFLIMYDGSPIGEMALKHINKNEESAELSIHMQQDKYKNKGYGTIAEKLLIEYANARFDIHTIYAKVIHKNERSIRVLQKVGFIKTGEDNTFQYFVIKRN